MINKIEGCGCLIFVVALVLVAVALSMDWTMATLEAVKQLLFPSCVIGGIGIGLMLIGEQLA